MPSNDNETITMHPIMHGEDVFAVADVSKGETEQKCSTVADGSKGGTEKKCSTAPSVISPLSDLRTPLLAQNPTIIISRFQVLQGDEQSRNQLVRH